MCAKLRRKANARKRKMLGRIVKSNWPGRASMIRPPRITYELANKQHAIALTLRSESISTPAQLVLPADAHFFCKWAGEAAAHHSNYPTCDPLPSPPLGSEIRLELD